MFAQYIANPASVTSADYDTFLEESFGAKAPEIKAQYPLSSFNSTLFPPIYAMAEVITASNFLCPSRRGLEVAAKKGIPVWTYRFSHIPKCSWEQKIPAYGVSLLGATHSSEIPFVLGYTSGLPPPNGTCEMTDDEKDISAFMVKAWTAMAASQKPGDDLEWPAWDNSQKSLGINIINSSEPGFVNYTECQLWDDINQAMLANATSNGSATPTAPSATAKTTSTSRASVQSITMAQILMWGLMITLMACV